MSISADIRVEKFLPDGSRKLDYHGEVLARSDAAVLLKARFTHPDMQFFGLDILNGDVFYELHYNDRFYNIFAIHAG
ncbi:MAG: hypothetical protein JW750_09370, partial [Anaerolineaceae bacterium]|nr:hypothetical protein [Anaerolineaceae bacterium]